MKLEYKVEDLYGDTRDIERLEQWAAEGWELVAAFPCEKTRGHVTISTVVAYLKRVRES